MFDENGDRKGLTRIEQLQDFVEVRVGVYHPSSNMSESVLVWENGSTIRWRGQSASGEVSQLLEMSVNFWRDQSAVV